MKPPAARLRALLDAPGLLLMPCCFDAWSARLVEAAGFPLPFDELRRLAGFDAHDRELARYGAGGEPAERSTSRR